MKLIKMLEERGLIDKTTGKVKVKLAILIKLNQNGFLTTGIDDPGEGYLGTLEVIRLAKKYGFKHVISHRSKEAEAEEGEVSIADLAAGTDAVFLKSGDHVQGIRAVKEDRLAEIIDGATRRFASGHGLGKFSKHTVTSPENVYVTYADFLIFGGGAFEKFIEFAERKIEEHNGDVAFVMLVGPVYNEESGIEWQFEQLNLKLNNVVFVKKEEVDVPKNLFTDIAYDGTEGEGYIAPFERNSEYIGGGTPRVYNLARILEDEDLKPAGTIIAKGVVTGALASGHGTKSSRRQQVDSRDQIIAIPASEVLANKKGFESWITAQPGNVAVVIISMPEEYTGVKEYEDIVYIKVVGREISEEHRLILTELFGSYGTDGLFGGFKLGDPYTLDKYKTVIGQIEEGV